MILFSVRSGFCGGTRAQNPDRKTPLLNRRVLRPLARRLLKSALRRYSYADKCRADPRLEGVLFLEEQIYTGVMADWCQHLNGVDLYNPLIRCEVTLILRSEILDARNQVEETLKNLGVEASTELDYYLQLFSPDVFLPGVLPS